MEGGELRRWRGKGGGRFTEKVKVEESDFRKRGIKTVDDEENHVLDNLFFIYLSHTSKRRRDETKEKNKQEIKKK